MGMSLDVNITCLYFYWPFILPRHFDTNRKQLCLIGFKVTAFNAGYIVMNKSSKAKVLAFRRGSACIDVLKTRQDTLRSMLDWTCEEQLSMFLL